MSFSYHFEMFFSGNIGSITDFTAEAKARRSLFERFDNEKHSLGRWSQSCLDFSEHIMVGGKLLLLISPKSPVKWSLQMGTDRVWMCCSIRDWQTFCKWRRMNEEPTRIFSIRIWRWNVSGFPNNTIVAKQSQGNSTLISEKESARMTQLVIWLM